MFIRVVFSNKPSNDHLQYVQSYYSGDLGSRYVHRKLSEISIRYNTMVQQFFLAEKILCK